MWADKKEKKELQLLFRVRSQKKKKNMARCVCVCCVMFGSYGKREGCKIGQAEKWINIARGEREKGLCVCVCVAGLLCVRLLLDSPPPPPLVALRSKVVGGRNIRIEVIRGSPRLGKLCTNRCCCCWTLFGHRGVATLSIHTHSLLLLRWDTKEPSTHLQEGGGLPTRLPFNRPSYWPMMV